METALRIPAPPIDDASLAERFRAGDEEAFAEIVTRHRRAVYLMALRLLGRHEDADEAAQLAFVRAWNGREQFRGAASVRTWLIRIGLNVAKTMRAGRRPSETPELLERMADDAASMTMTGDLLGTPNYMSPEQAMAKRVTLDRRTDIYSLGATLYEVLTLNPPFDGKSLQDLCSKIIAKDPVLPRRRNGRIQSAPGRD